MRKIAASVVKILLLSVGLFSLGPQFGSLDIDGDGVSDVPVIILDGGCNQNVQAQRGDRLNKVRLAETSPFLAPMCNDQVLVKARLVEPYGPFSESALHLRC